LLAGLLIAGFAGCADKRPTDSQEPGGVEVKPVTYAGFQDAVKQLKGKVVVVDFWADWCDACKGELRHLVDVHNRFAKDGVTVLAMNIDPPDDADVRKKVIKFLNDKHANFPNLVVAAGADPNDWASEIGESLPATWVYDRDGKLKQKFSGVAYEDIEDLVEKLVKTK
jgi:thiol-disulfide isomerase/thioredoxin